MGSGKADDRGESAAMMAAPTLPSNATTMTAYANTPPFMSPEAPAKNNASINPSGNVPSMARPGNGDGFVELMRHLPVRGGARR